MQNQDQADGNAWEDVETELLARMQPIKSSELTLVIGNKNYSSWSMRPWLLLVHLGVAFKEVKIPLNKRDTISRISEYSLAGRVPILVDSGLTVWDSLAICEYLAERYGGYGLWPTDRAARALARSICAEMHSGFGSLRTFMPMDIRGHYPGQGRNPDVQSDIARISEIWEECLERYGHNQFLFGHFSIADAYFAPVVMRFRSYAVYLTPLLQGYMERIMSHPPVKRWMEEAQLETDILPNEP